MKDKIYKFLDFYVGKGARVSPMYSEFRTFADRYEVTSDNGTLILWFTVRGDHVKVFRNDNLSNKISSYFSLPDEGEGCSWMYIRDWFGQRHNIQRISDLLKLIVKKEYETT